MYIYYLLSLFLPKDIKQKLGLQLSLLMVLTPFCLSFVIENEDFGRHTGCSLNIVFFLKML